jgi:hypothetical protein
VHGVLGTSAVNVEGTHVAAALEPDAAQEGIEIVQLGVGTRFHV